MGAARIRPPICWVTGLAKRESFAEAMVPKIADYLTSISKLIVVATFDLPGWVPLGFDLRSVGLRDWRRGRALRKPWYLRSPITSHRSQNSSLSQHSTCRDGCRSDSTSDLLGYGTGEEGELCGSHGT